MQSIDFQHSFPITDTEECF